MPDRVGSLKPEWEGCGGEWFYAYDPQKILTPAAAMAPIPTPEGRTPLAEPAKPSSTIDPGPKDRGAASPQRAEPKKNEDTQKNKDPKKNEDQKNEDPKNSEDPQRIENPNQNADPVVKPPSSKLT